MKVGRHELLLAQYAYLISPTLPLNSAVKPTSNTRLISNKFPHTRGHNERSKFPYISGHVNPSRQHSQRKLCLSHNCCIPISKHYEYIFIISLFHTVSPAVEKSNLHDIQLQASSWPLEVYNMARLTEWPLVDFHQEFRILLWKWLLHSSLSPWYDDRMY